MNASLFPAEQHSPGTASCYRPPAEHVTMSNTCGHSLVPIVQTRFIPVGVTLLTLMHCGSSPAEASSTSSAPQADLLWPEIQLCFKLSPMSREMWDWGLTKTTSEGAKWCTAFVLGPSHDVHSGATAFCQRCVSQTGYLLLSFDKSQHRGWKESLLLQKKMKEHKRTSILRRQLAHQLPKEKNKTEQTFPNKPFHHVSLPPSVKHVPSRNTSQSFAINSHSVSIGAERKCSIQNNLTDVITDFSFQFYSVIWAFHMPQNNCLFKFPEELGSVTSCKQQRWKWNTTV